ncbi:hypothetical protein KXX33_007773 [Aspergillus fumigatus]|nr:hypothetical protein KXX45_008929 [Aspergillus fumigatus]KAH1293188.1 hypothetical protein KXX48_005692 [Aspergillus fumigatus]KAH1355217.1 hypothetical protein KXX33_007773 [Aspergillus fumigatus]KAH1357283.1 hypothetical protein KXX63_009185 [Aspergillus fumigatus]KAH1404982.1 hypothetical protein KXX51_009435 [Aspergillus fumigatus]
MSLARTSNALRRWPYLYDNPLLLSTSYIPTNTRLSDYRTPRASEHKTTSPQATRPFHCTTSCYAARSPAARRAQAQTQRLRPVYSSDGLFNLPAHGDLTARLKYVDEKGPLLWMSALAEGLLDDKVSKNTFLDIAKRLLETAHRELPSADAIRGISSDPDLIFQIGYIVSGGNPSFREWLLASTTHAGARVPLLMSAARYLNSLGNTAPVRTPALEKVEHLALHDRDPRAMTLHAKVLGLRKRYTDALRLIEQVMALIYPSKVPVAKDGGFGIARIEPPWRVYAWLNDKAQAQANADTKTGEAGTKTDDLLRSAALDYQDPESLVQYATARMRAGDLAMYEDCMSRAATAGKAEACRRLANFYYLTSLGRYPRRGVHETEAKTSAPVEVAAKPASSASSRTSEPSNRGKLSALLSSVFGPQPRAEYRKLALEWYELAFSHGSEQAAVVLAVLLRKDGSAARGLQLLEQIEGSSSLGPFVRRIKAQWDEQGQEIGIPPELLDV